MRTNWVEMSRRTRVAWLLLLLLVSSPAALATELQAWLQSSQIGEGQSVDLYLVAPSSLAGDPELSALREDFDIVNIVEGSQLQMMNGYPVNMRSWQLTLRPKRPGRLSVPGLRLGQATSAPLALEVFPAGQVPANRVLRDVMLQTLVSQQRPYVQGKVIYTIRLYTRLDLHQVHFSEPEVMDTLVERLGDDNKYNTYLGRYRYHVLQRRYVLFPQRSGSLSVISPLLKAQVREKQRQWPLQLRGPEIALDVLPQPDATLDPWLPAESLSLDESWSPDPPRFRVGEPVNRSIVLDAQGVTAAQLPDLSPSVPQGISVYPERPVSTTRAVANTLVTRKVTSYALVPKRAGAYRLPEVSLAWWDTTTGERKVAVLAARDIEVLAGSAKEQTGSQVTNTSGYLSSLDLQAWWQTARRAWKGVSTSWPWLVLLLVLLLLAWLGQWIARRLARRGASPEGAPEPESSRVKPAEALRRFELACARSDPHLAREALIDWAALTWPQDPPQRLDQLAKRLPPRATDVLTGIDRALYAPKGEAWDGIGARDALQALLEVAVSDQHAKQGPQALPPLYPG